MVEAKGGLTANTWETLADEAIIRSNDVDYWRQIDALIASDDILGLYKKEALGAPVLDKEDQLSLAREAKLGSREAYEDLLQAQYRLCMYLAASKLERGANFIDLIQEGNLALIESFSSFDPSFDIKFSTYAFRRMNWGMERFIANHSSTIRLTKTARKKIHEAQERRSEMEQDKERLVSFSEAAEDLGWTPGSKRIIYPMQGGQASLNEFFKDSEFELGESLEDPESSNLEHDYAQNELRELFEEVFLLLTPREIEVISLHYGLETGEQMSLEKIGLQVGLSRERIRQIEGRAFKKIMRNGYKGKLREWLGNI